MRPTADLARCIHDRRPTGCSAGESGVPVQEMVTAATQVLNDGGRPVTKRVRVTNRRGRPVDIGLTVAALPEADGEAVAGVILMMEEANDTGAAGDKKA